MAKKLTLTERVARFAPAAVHVPNNTPNDTIDFDEAPLPDAADTAHPEGDDAAVGQCACGFHTAETCAENCDHPEVRDTARGSYAEQEAALAADDEPPAPQASAVVAPKHPQADHPALEGHNPKVIARALVIYDERNSAPDGLEPVTTCTVEFAVHQAVREFTGAGR